MSARSFLRGVATTTVAVLALAGATGSASADPRPAPPTTVDDVPPVPGGAQLSPQQGAPGTVVTIAGACGYDADDFGYFFEHFVNGQPVSPEQWQGFLPVANDSIASFSTSFHVPPAPPGMYAVHVWCDLDLESLQAERFWHLTFEVTPGRSGFGR